jgi:hypothetical protein
MSVQEIGKERARLAVRRPDLRAHRVSRLKRDTQATAEGVLSADDLKRAIK